MFSFASTNGRRQVIAMASMNIRAVLAPFELEYLAVPTRLLSDGAAAAESIARFQPRDERGRFVEYAALHTASAVDCARTFMEYALMDDREEDRED